MTQFNTTPNFQILSIDGGGVGGLYSLTILKRLYKAYPELLNRTDMFAGTSIGAFIGLALACDYKPSYIQNYFKDYIQNIFDKRHFGSGLINSKYSNKEIEKWCIKFFGEKKLKDIPYYILVPTFDLKTNDNYWCPKFFHNFNNSMDLLEKISDVILSSTAAPYYFPSYNGFVDGGIAANNPSMIAIIETFKHKHNIDKQITEDNIIVLSIGSGKYLNSINGDINNWGAFQWAPHIINMFMEGSNYTVEEECKLFLEDTFCRINNNINKDIKLDDTDYAEYIIDFAEKVNLDKEIEWLKKYW
jgi:uncharacterized protein